MRILEIIPQLSSGGGERFTVDLCNELSKSHKVRLILLHPLEKHGFYQNDISSDVEVISMNKKTGLRPILLYKMYKEIKRFNPDIIHSHLRGIMYVALSSIILRKGKKYFHTIHSDAEKEASDRFSRMFRRFLFRRNFIKPIAISEESLSSFQKFYGQTCKKIDNGRLISNNLVVSDKVRKEIESYKSGSSSRLIINLARIIKLKRQPLIARVCKRLIDEGYDFTMLFIGRRAEEDVVKALESVKCSNLRILGERSNPLEYMKLADGYCLFSEYEGLPISLIEALGTETVPICTPVGGIVNVIEDGVNGILADDLSEGACYIALKRFLDLSDTELNVMKQKALSSFKPYTMEECAKKYETYFTSH